jgi:hypothetical protein
MGDLGASGDLDFDLGIDGSGLFTDLLAKIHLGINDATRELQKQSRQEQARLEGLPNYVDMSRAGTGVANELIDFGGPQPGRQWTVKRWNADTVDGFANAGVPTLYVGQPLFIPGSPGFLPPTMKRWFLPSLPAQQNFGENQIVLKPGEKLIVGLLGVTGGKIAIMNLAIEDAILNDARFTVATS